MFAGLTERVVYNMEIKHFEILVTSDECGFHRPKETPADLTAYLLDPMSQAPERLRPAVVICPGGGFGFVSQREDQPVAMEFLSAGCQTFVLHYHVEPETFPLALMELARSIDLIRIHSTQWCIDTDNIIVCGFSAGGHLAGCLGTMWNREFLYGPLGLNEEDIRPGGLILGYPVITSGEYAHQLSFQRLMGPLHKDNPGLCRLLSLEYQAGPHVPRTFLWHTWTDQSVPVENSLLFAQALRSAGVNLELHIYPQGQHGLSLATPEVSDAGGDCVLPHCQGWISLAKEWIGAGRNKDIC